MIPPDVIDDFEDTVFKDGPDDLIQYECRAEMREALGLRDAALHVGDEVRARRAVRKKRARNGASSENSGAAESSSSRAQRSCR